MSVIGVITSDAEATALTNWSWHFARAHARDLLLLVVTEQPQPRQIDLHAGCDDADPAVAAACAAARQMIQKTGETLRATTGAQPPYKLPTVDVYTIPDDDPAPAILRCVTKHRAALLVLARHERKDDDFKDNDPARQLHHRAPCDLLVIRPGDADGDDVHRILVPTAGGPHATVALQLAAAIATQCGAQLDALYVEPNIGQDARVVGDRIVDRLVRRALGPAAGNVGRRMVIANDFREGVATAAKDGYDLVLLGASNQWTSRWFLFRVVPHEMATQSGESKGMAIAVMRKAIPLTTRIQSAAQRVFNRFVPQLEREDRITLVERVQSNAQWDFDFIMLVCLSTLIAGLGLLQNSGAVVIGAMLIAPLMTPLVGAGLALVHGNALLVRAAARSVCFGFLLAFAIGYILGFTVPLDEPTAQLFARGSPNVLDLAVAFISGIAAAYATARPNLSAALPGVAIAAALVPPIATTGIALAHGRPLLSAGAALLFFTNIIAIVLGAACSLFALGVHAAHEHSREKHWMRRTTMSLIVCCALLAVPLSYVLYAKLPVVRVTSELRQQMAAVVAVHPHHTLTEIHHIPGGDAIDIEVVIHAPALPPDRLAADLATLTQNHFNRPTRIHLVTQLVHIHQSDD